MSASAFLRGTDQKHTIRRLSPFLPNNHKLRPSHRLHRRLRLFHIKTSNRRSPAGAAKLGFPRPSSLNPRAGRCVPARRGMRVLAGPPAAPGRLRSRPRHGSDADPGTPPVLTPSRLRSRPRYGSDADPDTPPVLTPARLRYRSRYGSGLDPDTAPVPPPIRLRSRPRYGSSSDPEPPSGSPSIRLRFRSRYGSGSDPDTAPVLTPTRLRF
jgi:hypothetical protein